MKRLTVTTLALVFLAFGAADAQAQMQWSFGGQGSWANDFDFGVGARAEMTMDSQEQSILNDIRFAGSFDYFFPSAGPMGAGDFTYFEINGNGHYALPIEGSADVYAGGGLNVARLSASSSVSGVGNFSVSATEIGLNVLGGVRFPLGSMTAGAEGRFELGGGEQLVVSGFVVVP